MTDTNEQAVTEDSGTPVPAATPQPKEKFKGVSIFEAVMLSLLVSAITVFCYDHFYVKRIVVADLEGLSENLGQAVERKLISVDQAMARVDQAKEQVDKAGKNDIVLLGSVLLGKKEKYRYLDLPFVNLPPESKTGALTNAKPEAK